MTKLNDHARAILDLLLGPVASGACGNFRKPASVSRVGREELASDDMVFGVGIASPTVGTGPFGTSALGHHYVSFMRRAGTRQRQARNNSAPPVRFYWVDRMCRASASSGAP